MIPATRESTGALAVRESVPGTIALLLVCTSSICVPCTVRNVAEFGFVVLLSITLTTAIVIPKHETP